MIILSAVVIVVIKVSCVKTNYPINVYSTGILDKCPSVTMCPRMKKPQTRDRTCTKIEIFVHGCVGAKHNEIKIEREMFSKDNRWNLHLD